MSGTTAYDFPREGDTLTAATSWEFDPKTGETFEDRPDGWTTFTVTDVNTFSGVVQGLDADGGFVQTGLRECKDWIKA